MAKVVRLGRRFARKIIEVMTSVRDRDRLTVVGPSYKILEWGGNLTRPHTGGNYGRVGCLRNLGLCNNLGLTLVPVAMEL